MFHRTLVRAEDVHDTLRRHVLIDGYPIVVDLDHSGGSFLRDKLTGKLYLDFFSFFASNPIDLNHPGLCDAETQERLLRAARTKISNSDYYTGSRRVSTPGKERGAAGAPHTLHRRGRSGRKRDEGGFDWRSARPSQRVAARSGPDLNPARLSRTLGYT